MNSTREPARGRRAGQPLARLSLALTAVVFTGFGAWFLLAPHSLGLVGIELTRPEAAAEIRSIYGGLELGLGLFFLAAMRRAEWHLPALAVQVATLGGALIGRLAGVLVDGALTKLMLTLAAAEMAGALLGVAAYRALARSTPEPAPHSAYTIPPARGQS